MKRTILLALVLGASVGCSKLEKSLNNAAEMGDILGRTDGKIGKTVDGIHKQSLLLAVNELTKQVNMEKISPAPTALMPAAKVFAQEATPEEVVEFTHAWLKEIEEVAPMKDVDANGEEKPYSEAKLNEIRSGKMGRLYGLMAIAGFLSDEKLDQIGDQYVSSFDRFQYTALKIHMMRALFLRDILISSSLLSDSLFNSGSMFKAVEYMKQLEHVVTKPYANKIFLKVIDKSMKPAVMNDIDVKMDQETKNSMTVELWDRILNQALSTRQSLVPEEWGITKDLNQRTYQEELARQDQAIDLIKQEKAKWDQKLQ